MILTMMMPMMMMMTSAGWTADMDPSSARYFSSNLPISCAMLESGFFLTVELTAAKISHRFTSEPLSVMFLGNDQIEFLICWKH